VRNSWGSYWGDLGFFKVQRGAGGNGSLQIESGDCWYAEPEHSIEDAVARGELEGSMYGLKRNRCGAGGDGGGDGSGCRELVTDRLKQSWGDWPARTAPSPGRDGEGEGEEGVGAGAVERRAVEDGGWVAGLVRGVQRLVGEYLGGGGGEGGPRVALV